MLRQYHRVAPYYTWVYLSPKWPLDRFHCTVYREIFALKIFHVTSIHVEIFSRTASKRFFTTLTLLYLPFFHKHTKPACSVELLLAHHGRDKCKYLPMGRSAPSPRHRVLTAECAAPHLELLRPLERYFEKVFHLESAWKSVVENSETARALNCAVMYLCVHYRNFSAFLSVHRLFREKNFRVWWLSR